MDVADIAIATVTLARSPEEAPVIRASLEALADIGAPVVVADGGSPHAFVEAIEAIPGLTVLRTPGAGLIGQVRASLARASAAGARRLLYTEPDKHEFFATRLRPFFQRATAHDDAGVIVASRSASSFETYPPVQQYTETVANQLCGDATGVRVDFMYGPFLMSPQLPPYLDRLPLSVGWGWRLFAFGLAARLGLRLASVDDDHRCPPDQQLPDEAERLHRMRQLSQNIDGLVRSSMVDLRGQEAAGRRRRARAARAEARPSSTGATDSAAIRPLRARDRSRRRSS